MKILIVEDERLLADSLKTLARLGYTGVDWKNTCFDPDQDMTFQLKRAKHIADDMGLGKTLQTISVLAGIYPKTKKPSLIVMPRSVPRRMRRRRRPPVSRKSPQITITVIIAAAKSPAEQKLPNNASVCT